MPWVKTDDRMTEHVKVEALSDRAFRALFEALHYASRNLTDGFVSQAAAKKRGWTRSARELVNAGLWEPVEGGWAIHDFLEYNPSREQVERDRERTAQRVKRHRNAVTSNVTPTVSNGRSTGAPYPDPLPDPPDPPPEGSPIDRLVRLCEAWTYGTVSRTEHERITRLVSSPCALKGCLDRHIDGSRREVEGWKEPPKAPWAAFAKSLGNAIASCEAGAKAHERNGRTADGVPIGMPR